jgi:hypothetical protein
MPSRKSYESSKPNNDVECNICHKKWDIKGIGNHQRACEKKHLLNLQQQAYEKQLEASKPTSGKFCFVSSLNHIN